MVSRWAPVGAFALSLVAISLASQRAQKTRIVASIHELEPCPNKNSSLLIRNVTISKDSHANEMIGADFLMTKKVNYISKFVVTTQRHAEGKPWEYVGTWKYTTAICGLLPAKNAVWTPIVQNFSPAVKCPIARGLYRLANGTLDFRILEAMATGYGGEKYTWRSELNAFDELGDLIACASSTAHFVRVLDHGKDHATG